VPEYYGYGYEYFLIPDQSGSSEFPCLSYSGPKLFLKFINNEIIFELRDLARYKGIKGFDEYYEGIKNLDIYGVKAKEQEIREVIKKSHALYASEYAKYLKTTFLIDQDDLITVSESDYNIDSGAMSNIHLPFAQRIMARVYGGDYSDPYEVIMPSFGEQGTYPKWNHDRYRKFDFKIPVPMAKKYFEGFSGPVGSRIGACHVRYWVRPTRGALTGVRLWITSMDLRRVEVTFLGNELFSEVWLPGKQFTLTKEVSALRLTPSTVLSQCEKLLKENEDNIALTYANILLRQDPNIGGAHSIVAAVMDKNKKYQLAIHHLSKAAELEPNAKTYNSLAWFLSTCPDATKRDSPKAVEIAKKAVELDAGPGILDTLAAAYAENGQFDLAVSTEEAAYAKSNKDTFRQLIIAYKAHKTYLQVKLN
jgi:tetratricopeptide (TPR) repeat protein